MAAIGRFRRAVDASRHRAGRRPEDCYQRGLSWDLIGFGGHNPYVALFGDRPDALPRAQCFPGAHASSGFALFCLYFVFRDNSRRMARWMLAVAIAVGIAFSIGQEARGAHFLSHDVTSAAIVWFVQLALYARVFEARAIPSPEINSLAT